MKIGIIGCGWLGIRLAKFLQNQHEIFATITSTEKKKALKNEKIKFFLANFDDFTDEKWEILPDLDTIIITIPFGKHLEMPILEKRLKNLSKFIENYSKQLFFTSSVGIYPSVETEIFEDFPSQALETHLFFVEHFLQKKFPQINILRLGGLMGDNRKLSNYPIKEPYQVANHIHYQDVIKIIDTMITLGLHSKVYNVVAPEHPVKQTIIDFQKGNSFSEKNNISYGKKVSSQKLQQELSYEFIFPNPIYFL